MLQRIQGRFDFFPVNRALSLSVDNDDKTEKLDEILSKLQAVIERSEKEVKTHKCLLNH